MNFSKITSKLTYTIFAMSLLFTVACKKDKDGGDGPIVEPGAKKITRIENDANNYITFEYNGDGTLKKIHNVSEEDEEALTGVMNLSYNANKKIDEITNANGSRIKYLYTNNVVTSTDIFDELDNKVAYTEFSYQGNKLASATLKVPFENEQGENDVYTVLRAEYQYYANGDVKEVHAYLPNMMTGELEKSTVTKYEQYDDKVNPLSQLGEISVLFFADVSGRNVRLQKEFDANGTLEETITNEYTYDAQGFPTACKETTTPAGGTASVRNVKYFYN